MAWRHQLFDWFIENDGRTGTLTAGMAACSCNNLRALMKLSSCISEDTIDQALINSAASGATDALRFLLKTKCQKVDPKHALNAALSNVQLDAASMLIKDPRFPVNGLSGTEEGPIHLISRTPCVESLIFLINTPGINVNAPNVFYLFSSSSS
jgi:hypothetical protein